MMMFKILSFKGGGTLILREMPHMETVSMGIWAGVGSRHETKGQEGISHFLEHMIFKGTKKRSSHQISQEVEGIGGYLNAFTTEENTCYYARVTGDHFSRVADVLTDMYQSSVFSPEEIKKERGVILEELSMIQDQPSQKVQEILQALLWPAHPLGSPIAGTVKSVKSLKRRDLIGYFHSRYNRNNTVVSLAGKFNVDEAQSLFCDFFKKLPAGQKAGFKKFPNKNYPPAFLYEEKEIEQVNAVLGFRGLSRSHPMRYAAKLLNVILGENMSSRLFQVIREQHGLAYSIGSGQSLFSDTGALTIFGGLPFDKYARALALIGRELHRIKTKKVMLKELNQAKDYTIGMMSMGLESTTDQMIWGGESYLAYGRVQECPAIKKKLEEVSISDIQEVANLLFTPKQCALAVIGPKSADKPTLHKIIDLN